MPAWCFAQGDIISSEYVLMEMFDWNQMRIWTEHLSPKEYFRRVSNQSFAVIYTEDFPRCVEISPCALYTYNHQTFYNNRFSNTKKKTNDLFSSSVYDISVMPTF